MQPRLVWEGMCNEEGRGGEGVRHPLPPPRRGGPKPPSPHPSPPHTSLGVPFSSREGWWPRLGCTPPRFGAKSRPKVRTPPMNEPPPDCHSGGGGGFHFYVVGYLKRPIFLSKNLPFLAFGWNGYLPGLMWHTSTREVVGEGGWEVARASVPDRSCQVTTSRGEDNGWISERRK